MDRRLYIDPPLWSVAEICSNTTGLKDVQNNKSKRNQISQTRFSAFKGLRERSAIAYLRILCGILNEISSQDELAPFWNLFHCTLLCIFGPKKDLTSAHLRSIELAPRRYPKVFRNLTQDNRAS